MPDNSVEIAEIESVLNAGETSSTVDGSSVTNDLKTLQNRLIYLKRTHVGPEGERQMVKPVSASIRLTGL